MPHPGSTIVAVHTGCMSVYVHERMYNFYHNVGLYSMLCMITYSMHTYTSWIIIWLPLFHGTARNGMAYSVALFSGTERLKCLDISSKSLSNTILCYFCDKQNEPAVSCSR